MGNTHRHSGSGVCIRRVLGVGLALFWWQSLISAEPDAPTKAEVSSPEAADILSSFQIKKGFRIELVASEPTVEAPVAMAFDENGRLFVAEMRDYPDRRDVVPHAGRIRVLEDTDGEGKFSQSTVYAENLPWPSALACYGGGVFVGVTPDIIYLKDTSGNGNADVRGVVFSGFGETNTASGQALLSSFAWGLDNHIHGLAAGIVGVVKAVGASEFEPLLLAGNDFSFNPRSFALWPETGSAQSGLSFDSRGRKFVSDFARPLMMPTYEARYAWRNPFSVKPPALAGVMSPATRIFRFTEVEMPRTNSVQPLGAGGPVQTELRRTNVLAASWLSNAVGTLVYRGSAFPPSYFQNVFIADPEAHVIHRAVLRENGLQIVAERAPDERDTEFLASKDPSFRPMQVIAGPEGALYVADMNTGGNRGRIYRIVPENLKQPKFPQLGKASTSELVVALASPNGWHSDTAARLLYQRQEAAAVPMLSNMLSNSKLALVRLRAMHALDGLGALQEAHVLKGLRDEDERVREHALALLERVVRPGLVSPEVANQLQALVADSSVRVRYQLAFTLAALQPRERALLLSALLRRDLINEWFQAAVLNSLPDGAGEMLVRVAGDAQIRSTPAGQQFLWQLASMIGVKGQMEEVTQAISFLGGASLEPQVSFALVSALGEGLHRTRSSLALADRGGQLQGVYAQALKAVMDDTVAWPLRVEAIRVMGVSPYAYTNIGDWLCVLLAPAEPPLVRAASIAALGRFNDPRVSSDLVQRWNLLPPALRTEAVGALLTRIDRGTTVLAALESGRISAGDLTRAQLDFLRTHADPAVRRRAVQLFGMVLVRRPAVVEQFRPALRLKGVAGQGRSLFQMRCAACHSLGGQGGMVGPDLTGAKVKGKERILTAILEPNLEMTPGYATCVLTTSQGEGFFGVKVDENPVTVTLRQLNGAETVWPLANLRAIERQAWSLMPVGLEAGLTPQAMADLLEYIMSTPR